MMEYVTLNNGVKMPKLGYGVYQVSNEECERCVLDAISVGYPNWWADLPMAVYSFFDEYDFSGKTIIPFNVHNGSRFSRTIETIQELEPNATVIEDGFTISEQNVPKAADDVASWLQEIGY